MTKNRSNGESAIILSQDILGAPDFGPEIGMDNLYYMEYFGGEINDQIPDVFISFVAVSVNSPTDHVFIKREAFDYEKKVIKK